MTHGASQKHAREEGTPGQTAARRRRKRKRKHARAGDGHDCSATFAECVATRIKEEAIQQADGQRRVHGPGLPVQLAAWWRQQRFRSTKSMVEEQEAGVRDSREGATRLDANRSAPCGLALLQALHWRRWLYAPSICCLAHLDASSTRNLARKILDVPRLSHKAHTRPSLAVQGHHITCCKAVAILHSACPTKRHSATSQRHRLRVQSRT